MSKRLVRDQSNKVIAGVCSGLGNYFNVDPVLVRVAFVLAVIAFVALVFFHSRFFGGELF